MGLIHTPRTLARVALGLWKKRSRDHLQRLPTAMGPHDPHIYNARLGFVDIDYLGHLNNAAYLSNAELARWELTATSGMLQSMIQSRTNFIVTASCVRYRQEISPLFRKYQIESYVAGMDERYMFIVHNFRYPGADHRVRAQVVIGAVAKNRSGVVNPVDFLVNTVGFPSESVEPLIMPSVSDESMESVLESFVGLQDAMREASSVDDQRIIR